MDGAGLSVPKSITMKSHQAFSA
jgi:Bardet-Biedl syndrome 4 protein